MVTDCRTAAQKSPGCQEFPPIGSARKREDAEDPSNTASTWTGGSTTGNGALGPSGASAFSLGLASSTCSDHAAWKAQLHQQVNSARALRRQAHHFLRRDLALDLAAGAGPGPGGEAAGGASLSSVPSCTSVAVAAEDRKKKRMLAEKDLSTVVLDRMKTLETSIHRMTTVIAELQRSAGRRAALRSVADKRLELRARRPQSENVMDDLQVALQTERESHVNAIETLAVRVREGHTLLDDLQISSAELNRSRHTLHLDRTGRPFQFLDDLRALESSSAEFCFMGETFVKRVAAEAGSIVAKTTAALKRHVGEMVEYRRTLENEVWETQSMIFETERQLNKVAHSLHNLESSAEHTRAQEIGFDEDGEGTAMAAELHGACETNGPPLQQVSGVQEAIFAKIREKVKAAAYAGHAGPQLDALFRRFDRDNSGELDEDEFRKALRRTLRISPSVVSDKEISLMVHTLDLDKSGSINISELIRFLGGNSNAVALRRQRGESVALLEQLRGSKAALDEELKNKTLAWKIDDSCIRVTPIKGLELDALPPSGSARPRARGRVVATRRKPLPPEKVKRLQARLRAAAFGSGGSSSSELEALFGRYDALGTGMLEEEDLRRAFRGGLRVPVNSVSDSEIACLFDKLKADQDVAVGVTEVAAFVGLPPREDQAALEPVAAGGRRPLGAGAAAPGRRAASGADPTVEPSSARHAGAAAR